MDGEGGKGLEGGQKGPGGVFESLNFETHNIKFNRNRARGY